MAPGLAHPNSPFQFAPDAAQAPLLIGKVKNALREGVKNILVTGGAGFMYVSRTF